MNKAVIGILILLVLLGGASIWSRKSQTNDPEVVASNGIHWHPELEIYVKGERIEIPNNLGVGRENANLPTYSPTMGMTQIHTHTDPPIIHLEFEGKVTREETRLKHLFSIWQKDFMEFGTTVSMTVNGE